MGLSGQQRKELQSALIDAFPDTASLEQMLAFELDKNLRVIAGEGSLQDIVFKLIQTANSQGWVEDLVRAGCGSNPRNPRLRAIAREILLNYEPETSSGISQGNSPTLGNINKSLSFDESCSDHASRSAKGNVDYIRSEIVQPPQIDDLSSARSVDYTKLRDLLAAGNWENADYETYSVMLKVLGRREDDWIRDKEFLNFPCTDLRTIDNLWVKYSNGRFGFSVQKKIYLEIGGKPDGKYDPDSWNKFGERVGWKMKSWRAYSEITFDTTAPEGHLPASICRENFDVIFVGRWFGRVSYADRAAKIACRLVSCKI